MRLDAENQFIPAAFPVNVILRMVRDGLGVRFDGEREDTESVFRRNFPDPFRQIPAQTRGVAVERRIKHHMRGRRQRFAVSVDGNHIADLCFPVQRQIHAQFENSFQKICVLHRISPERRVKELRNVEIPDHDCNQQKYDCGKTGKPIPFASVSNHSVHLRSLSNGTLPNTKKPPGKRRLHNRYDNWLK